QYTDIAFPRAQDHGIWFVQLDKSRCLGMNWLGRNRGGYFQCNQQPAFPDGKCYEHSSCESLEMTAFIRKLTFWLGPREPNPVNLLTLGMFELENLYETLKKITPLTGTEFRVRTKLIRSFKTAYATLKWKRRQSRENLTFNIPPEFGGRKEASSINPFEYSLKKLFSLLGISANSTREETLRAWKQLARLHHPDASGSDSDEKMKELNMVKDRIFKIRRWN
ncbi:MAG: J domain-containing protein, partial [Desulfomonilaceae bacterium]